MTPASTPYPSQSRGKSHGRRPVSGTEVLPFRSTGLHSLPSSGIWPPLPARLWDREGRLAHPSVVRVYPVHQVEEVGLGAPVLETLQKAGVIGVDVTDEGLLAVACGDGFIRIYSALSGDRPLKEIRAHNGFSFAVCWAAPGKCLASYGQDGILKVFDYPEGTSRHASNPCPVAANAALAALSVDRSRGILYHGCGDGHLHALELETGEERVVEAHTGGVLAVCYHPLSDKVITGGQQDGKVSVWEPEPLTKTSETSPGVSVLGLVPLSEDGVAVLDGGGSVSLYGLAPAITFRSQVASLNARSWAGPDLAPLAHEQKQGMVKALTASRDRARECIRNNDPEGVLQEIRNLADKGFGVDAMILHAALCRKQGTLLQEYRIWEDLRTQSGGDLPGEPCEYLFAELLELLMEPRSGGKCLSETRNLSRCGPAGGAAGELPALRTALCGSCPVRFRETGTGP